MPFRTNSFSSALMLGTTIHRNQPGISHMLTAQVGYALIIKVALVESAVALFFSVLSLAYCCCSSKPFDNATTWLGSSLFVIGWAFVDFFLNIFLPRLVGDEKSARTILESRNLMMIPRGAIF